MEKKTLQNKTKHDGIEAAARGFGGYRDGWGNLVFHTYIGDRDNHHGVLLFFRGHPGQNRGQRLLQVGMVPSANGGDSQCERHCRQRHTHGGGHAWPSDLNCPRLWAGLTLAFKKSVLSHTTKTLSVPWLTLSVVCSGLGISALEFKVFLGCRILL